MKSDYTDQPVRNTFGRFSIMKKFVIAVLVLMLALTAFAEDTVMFNYQGRVKVQGQEFNGTGHFKFAIVNNPGSSSLWSNDMTSENGGEPDTAITANVQEGIFNVTIGDPEAGMDPINRTVFNHPHQIKLRTWFSDGEHGFQRLLPDRKLHNVELMGMTSGDEDFTIFVDWLNGDDENNGLTTETAKQHIQAAVDVLPARLNCNVTIDIADGTYYEAVNIMGITVDPEKFITLIGDEEWTPDSEADPSVKITGRDEATSDIIRNYAVTVNDSMRIQLEGIHFEGTGVNGISCSTGASNFIKFCKSSNNERGFRCGNYSTVNFHDCLAENNSETGFLVIKNSCGKFYNCISQNNDYFGILLTRSCSGMFYESGKINDNTEDGIRCQLSSYAVFDSDYSGEIKNNGAYGIGIQTHSFTVNDHLNTITGNAEGNVSGSPRY